VTIFCGKGGTTLIDTNALKGIITAKGTTQQDVAIAIGMTPKTFYSKMKKGVFGSDEMERMIEILDIEKPIEIFFAKEVTS
jgi:hypothetical protein